MNDNKKLTHELILACLEGTITEEQLAVLKQLLRDDDEAAQYYVEISSMISQFRRSEFKPEVFGDNKLEKSEDYISFDLDLWKSLAENEIQAPKVTCHKHIESPELIEKVIYKENPRQINKFSLYSLIATVAALLLLIIYVQSRPHVTVREVATLVDSMNAQWARTSISMQNGFRLSTNQDSILLSKGIAELLFDNNTKVVLEAPVEFQLISEDQIKLNYGKLYATVPTDAVGFTVNTQNARIIDLGTEFAIKADYETTTELHVIKGKTSLIAGKKNRSCSQVDEGVAKRISGLQGAIKDIPCLKGEFVREIDSARNMAWRGQNLDAANLIAGGNGIADGPYFKRIDPLTGIYSSENQLKGPDSRIVSNDFKTVSLSGIVDGVAVPCGLTKISTQGNSFNCTRTSNTFTWNIIAFNNEHNESNKDFAAPVFNQGQKYGDKDSPALLLHSNVLLTLDLQKIHSFLPENTIKRFKAWGGITETVVARPDKAKVDFFVLIDGEVRYQKPDLTVTDGVINMDIAINQQDRFLTIIVTEGNEDPNAWYPPLSNDFFYLINPEFVL